MSDDEEDEVAKGRSEPTTQMSMMRYKHKSHTRSHLLKELRALNVTAKEVTHATPPVRTTSDREVKCALTLISTR